MATTLPSPLYASLLLLLLAAVLSAPKHLIALLMLMEGMGLTLLFFLTISAKTDAPFMLAIFFLLVFMVCEAALGLSAVVLHSRYSGSQLAKISLFKLKKLQTFKVCIIYLFSMIITVNFQLKNFIGEIFKIKSFYLL